MSAGREHGPAPLTLTPIGVARTPFSALADAPRQPYASDDAAGRVELLPGRGLEDAVVDLDGFTHLWILYWFHRARGWRPRVLPPRSDVRRGVLATRSPHRPNPLGLSLVRLERVDGLTLHVRGLDAVDGTPVLDVKPYLPFAEAVPAAGAGWVGADPEPPWQVRFSATADAALALLASAGHGALRGEAARRLALGPRPHAYRRIRALGDGRYVLALRDWRLGFRADPDARAVDVVEVRSGYRPAELWGRRADDPALAVHRAVERLAVERSDGAERP